MNYYNTELHFSCYFFIIEDMKKTFIFALTVLLASSLFALPFNEKLTEDEKAKVESGQILIRNIDYTKYMSFKEGTSKKGDFLLETVKNLKPKYLAEVIQIKPYKGNENYADILEEMLYKVEEFTNIPYISNGGDEYLLYDSAEILETKDFDDHKNLYVHMYMEPFADVYQNMNVYKNPDELLYTSKNTNKLRYLDKFDCLWPEKMLITIYLFRDGDNWIFYSVGAVNAPHVPFFTDRIRRSFIRRITTFSDFIFKQF